MVWLLGSGSELRYLRSWILIWIRNNGTYILSIKMNMPVIVKYFFFLIKIIIKILAYG